MRALILFLSLALPLGLAACADSPTEEAYEENALLDDQEAVVDDGLLYGVYDLDQSGYIEETEWTEGGLVGDFGEYDVDQSGYLNETEYGVYESSLEM